MSTHLTFFDLTTLTTFRKGEGKVVPVLMTYDTMKTKPLLNYAPCHEDI